MGSWQDRIVGASGALLAVCLGAAIATALRADPVGQAPPAAAPTVKASVVVKAINETLDAEVEAVALQRSSVTRDGVYTADGVQQNVPLKAGDVVTVVNDQATLIGLGAFPLYRDLGVGDSGRDVAQVKHFLGSMGYPQSSGDSLDQPAASALVTVYEKSGYPLRHGDTWKLMTDADLVLPREQLLFMAKLPALASGDCGAVGAASDAPVCEVRTEASVAVLKIPKALAPRLTPGLAVYSAGSVGEPDWELGDRLPGLDEADEAYEYYKLVGGPPAAETGSESLRARVVLRESTETTVVPAAAVGEVDGTAGEVRLVDGTRVGVTVEMCARGECAVSGDLREGQEVIVS